jgi:nucleoside-diphosphate kinase
MENQSKGKDQMSDNHLTLGMIKPHAVRARNVGKIISRIEDAGFAILIVKSVQLQREGAEIFYEEHKGKDFFPNLTSVMCSGPVWPMVLKKHDAVNEFRTLIGTTHPAEAEPDTIRYQFGDHDNVTLNAIHGSANAQDALREIGFFFGREIKLAKSVDALTRQEGVI